MLSLCPDCNAKEKLRPYGSEVLSPHDGGCYYKLCTNSECSKAFAVAKLGDEIVFRGSLEGLLEYQRIRSNRGCF